MTVINVPETLQLFALAQRFYREPQEYDHLLRQDVVVPKLGEFLRVLNRPLHDQVWHEIGRCMSDSPEHLRNCGLFLLKGVLFTGSNSNYRLFGLEEGSPLEKIKERYHLLIALFHPDRNPQSSEWNDLYAPRLNSAYNKLKSWHRQANCDVTIAGVVDVSTTTLLGDEIPAPVELATTTVTGIFHPKKQPIFMRANKPSSKHMRLIMPFGKILIKPVVYTGTGFIAGLLIGFHIGQGYDTWPLIDVKMWPNRLINSDFSDQTADQTTARSPVAVISQTDENVVEAGRSGLPKPMLLGIDSILQAQHVDTSDAPKTAPSHTAGPELTYFGSVRPDLEIVPPVPKNVSLQSRDVPRLLPSEQAKPSKPLNQPNRLNSSDQLDRAIVNAPKQISANAVHTLLRRLSIAYIQGDAKAFAALFAEDAVTSEERNRDAVYKAYDALFKNTKNRNFSVHDVSWNIVGEDVALSFKITAVLEPITATTSSETTKQRRLSSAAKITARLQVDSLVIKKFTYSIANRQ